MREHMSFMNRLIQDHGLESFDHTSTIVWDVKKFASKISSFVGFFSNWLSIFVINRNQRIRWLSD